MKKGDLVKIIEMSIDELNQELPNNEIVKEDKSTKLFGGGGLLVN